MPPSVINLNDTLPAAPADSVNVKWQKGATTGDDPSYGYPIFPVSGSVPYMVGDAGSGGAAGLVPAPAAGDAAAGKYLKADGTFQTPSLSSLTHAEPLTDGNSNFIFANGDTVVVVGVPN